GECADAVTRQLREEVRQVGARGVPVQSEAALGEGDVPAVPGGDPFEGGASAAGADEDEGGGFGVTAEGRHAGFPAGGDEVPAPALLVDVPVEPAGVDAADLADVFEESAHIPLEVTQALRGALGGDCGLGGSRVAGLAPVGSLPPVHGERQQFLLVDAEEGRGRLGRRPRVGQVDLGGDRTGEFQGAAQPGVQAELQQGVEREALADQFPGGLGDALLAREQPLDPVHIVQVGRYDRGEEPLPGDGGAADQGGDQLVQRDAVGSELLVATYAFGELLVDEGAQGELPGPAGDE